MGSEPGSSFEVCLMSIWMPPDLWLGDLEPIVCGKLFKKCDLLWPWHSGSTLTYKALLLLSSPPLSLLKGYLGSHIFHKEPRAWNSLTFVWCLELHSTFHLYARIWPLKPPGGWKERSHYPLYRKGSHAGLPGVSHRYVAQLVFEYWFVLAPACPTHPPWWTICPSSPHRHSFFFFKLLIILKGVFASNLASLISFPRSPIETMPSLSAAFAPLWCHCELVLVPC